MARYYGIGPNKETIAYNMERCEELVLIDAYIRLENRMQTTDPLRNEFDYYFFRTGQGISSKTIGGLNALLRRAGMEPLSFAETTIYEYGRNPDRAWKARERAKMRSELEGMSDDARQNIVASAQSDKEALPPPPQTWREYRDDRERQEEEKRQSRAASIRDAARLRAMEKAPSVTQSLPPELAMTLLAATDDAELQDEIFGRIAVDHVAAVLDAIKDETLKNRLVRHTLTRFHS